VYGAWAGYDHDAPVATGQRFAELVTRRLYRVERGFIGGDFGEHHAWRHEGLEATDVSVTRVDGILGSGGYLGFHGMGETGRGIARSRAA
jgi:hypothetical protein